MQAKMKRFTIVALAVGLALILLVGSALAFNVSYQKVSMPDPYGIMPLSLNDSGTSRTFYNSKAIRVGYNSSSYTNLPAGSSLSFAHSGTTNHLWSDGTSTISKYYYLYIPASTYVDVYANIAFSANEYESLFFTGGGTYYLYTIFATSSTCAYPSTAQILVNGSPVGEAVSVSSSGAFMFPDLEVALTADVTTVGVRFTYSSAQTKTYTNTGSTGGRNLNQYFADNISITPIVKESLDYTPYLERLIAWQQSIYSNISVSNSWLSQILDSLGNLASLSEMVSGIQTIITPTEEDQSAVDEFDEQIQNQISEADKIQDAMESLDTPPPAEIVPDVSTIVTPEDTEVYSSAIGGLFENSTIVSMIMISLMVCLVSYVLFGKK